MTYLIRIVLNEALLQAQTLANLIFNYFHSNSSAKSLFSAPHQNTSLKLTTTDHIPWVGSDNHCLRDWLDKKSPIINLKQKYGYMCTGFVDFLFTAFTTLNLPRRPASRPPKTPSFWVVQCRQLTCKRHYKVSSICTLILPQKKSSSYSKKTQQQYGNIWRDPIPLDGGEQVHSW
jgi:hypothetical protein